MRVPPVGNPMYATFEEYKKVPETVPLDFSVKNVMSVVSKLSDAAGALGAEVIELINSLLCFGCALEEFRVVVTDLTD